MLNFGLTLLLTGLTMFGIAIFSTSSDSFALGAIGVVIGAIGFAIYKAAPKPEKKEPDPSAPKYDPKTEKERQKLHMMYQSGHLSLQEWDVLDAKLTGRKSATEIMGYNAMKAASDKNEVERKIAKHQKDANKSIIYSGAIGGAIGGIGGTIVGASSAASRAAAKNAQLSKELEAAEAKYQKALEDSAKNKLGW